MTIASAPERSTAERLRRAVEVFARGFAFTRSFTHPYVVDRVGPVWALCDETRKRAADYRREEYIACGTAPAEVDRIARANTRGRYAISAIRAADEPEAPIRDGYKALGYRLGTTEPLMAHGLQKIPRLPEPYPIRSVRTQEVADRLAQAARSRQVLPEHLVAGSPLRQYVALDGNAIVGWVRSIDAGRGATWVSNMYVLPQYRRRGVGRSMLAKMLRDDRSAGATASVLTASHTGALLYPVVGYELIGMLYLFTPTRR